MMQARYPTADAFKQALEQRLRTASRDGLDFARRRQLLVFDRFLARVAVMLGDAATLKGGLVLELRLHRARTTRDVDLRLIGSSADIHERLRLTGRLDLGDFMTFEVRTDREHPDIQNDGMQYDGLRFRCECKLGGKLYGQAFGLDVAFGDPMLGAADVVQGRDVLGFAGIKPPTLRLYPVETHVAEKLHAYTMPRPRPNSRVKDLPDIALLATLDGIEGGRLREACRLTFDHRATHPLPMALPPPPDRWRAQYAAMAREDRLLWSTLPEVTAAAMAFLSPVLGANLRATWDPATWSWRS
jgi:hypothetical protein